MRKIQLQGLTRLFTPNYRFQFYSATPTSQIATFPENIRSRKPWHTHGHRHY